jgi:hypothetical protein
MSMIEYVDASNPSSGIQLWSADDLREGSDDPAPFTDKHIGVLIHAGGQDGSGRPDGAMVYGTEAEVIGMLEQAITLIRREHAAVYGTAETPNE